MTNIIPLAFVCNKWEHEHLKKPEVGYLLGTDNAREKLLLKPSAIIHPKQKTVIGSGVRLGISGAMSLIHPLA